MLVEQMCQYFIANTASNPLPKEVLLAHITVLPRLGKEPSFCSNYRLISLLNTDTKILSKLLARLQDLVALVVYTDQTGFLVGGEAFDYTIKALHVLHQAKHGLEKS